MEDKSVYMKVKENKKNSFFIDILKKIYYKYLPFDIQAWLTKIIFKPVFGKNMTISRGRKQYYGKVRFGNGVRIAGNSIFTNIIVGNYTVFAEHFRMLGFVHNYHAFSINNILSEKINSKYLIDEKRIQGIQPRIDDYPITYIGNDVWIGEYVTVKGGIHIGDGAVIASNSVVTKDVPPFQLWGGVPAKFIKWRFSENEIKFIEKVRWWDWPEDKIADNYVKLCNFDQSLLQEKDAD